MKPNLISFAILWLASSAFAQNLPAVFSNNSIQLQALAFIENKGQVVDQYSNPRPDVLYGVMAGDLAVHIKKSGVSYQLYKVDSYKDLDSRTFGKKQKIVDRMSIYRVDLTWLNFNTNFTQTQDETLPGYSNYYLEGCPNGALYVKSFSGVTLKNLYKGIDLHYYEVSGELKHDYIVSPGADYKQIKIKVEGAELVKAPDGSLLFRTPFGSIQEAAPVAHQNNRKVDAQWKITGNILEFEIAGYDPTLELTIDPVTRLWATYYGGSYGDAGEGCSTDANGNVFMAGFTNSTNSSLIATSGSHQSTSTGGDAYLVKMNAAGVRQWATYYGGNGLDKANACTNDGAGNTYVTGYSQTQTSGVISTPGAHQVVFGGYYDAFLVKFNTSGIRLWGTYYGGGGDEEGTFCTVDAAGNLYLTGFTTSSGGSSIATSGAHQSTWGGGNANYPDAFLVKFTSNGGRVWGTYYGGNYPDFAKSCATDISGNVYIAGFAGTGGQNGVIATAGSHQGYAGGGDGFLVKFTGNGGRLWGTYYGGSAQDFAQSCATDGAGNVYLAGRTAPSTFNAISTPAGHQTNYGGGLTDGFLSKFDGNGVRLWGTFYGGAGDEEAFSCKADALGNAYLTGTTSANPGTIIATAGSYQQAYGGGSSDAFVAKFNAIGLRQWGTFYGGNGNEEGYSCAADNIGNVFLSGETDSKTGISTSGSHQSSWFGFTDAFLAKLYACNAPAQPSQITGDTFLCSPAGDRIYSIAAVTGATSYTWSLPPSWSGSSNTNSISATLGTTGVLSAVAGNSCGVSLQQTLQVVVQPMPVVAASTNISTICEGESATLTAAGAASYTFSPGGTASEIQVSPAVTTTYTVVGLDVNGCSDTTTLVQIVDACAGLGDNMGEKAFKLYPNPTSGVLNFEIESACSMVVINAVGQIIYSNSFDTGQHVLNLVDLPDGIFMLNITQGENSRCIKMVKVR